MHWSGKPRVVEQSGAAPKAAYLDTIADGRQCQNVYDVCLKVAKALPTVCSLKHYLEIMKSVFLDRVNLHIDILRILVVAP